LDFCHLSLKENVTDMFLPLPILSVCPGLVFIKEASSCQSMVMVLKRLILHWLKTDLSFTVSYTEVLATLCMKVKRYISFYALDFLSRMEALNKVN
jgi:hypothetical protein